MCYVRVKGHLFGHMFTMQAQFVAEHFAKSQITEVTEFSLVWLSIVFLPVLIMISKHLCAQYL